MSKLSYALLLISYNNSRKHSGVLVRGLFSSRHAGFAKLLVHVYNGYQCHCDILLICYHLSYAF